MANLNQIIDAILEKEKTSFSNRLFEICNVLKDSVKHYDWVGFYFLDKSKNELVLGPFVGENTDHTRIPVGKGICGQVAVSNEKFVVQDIEKETNYLSCSPTVKSEIVIPIIVNNDNIGQIDIDSHSLSPFTSEDEDLLSNIVKGIAKIIEKENLINLDEVLTHE